MKYGTPLALHDTHVLRVSTWNASGLKSARKLQLAIALMQTAGLDILCIQDTRIERGVWATELVRLAKEALGPGSSAFLSPISARPLGSTGSNTGGQLLLKSSRVGVASNFWCDESTLGVVCSIDIKMGGEDLRVVSVYVPPDKGSITKLFLGKAAVEIDHLHDMSESILDMDYVSRGRLVNRVQQFTSTYRQGESAAEYILDVALQRIRQHGDNPGCSALCVGDFNANGTIKKPASVNGDITAWSQSAGLLNATTVLTPHGGCPSTFYRQGSGVSDIDHVLFSRDKGLLPVGWRVMDESLWQLLSNHCPLVIDFEIPQFMEAYRPRRKRRRRTHKPRPDIGRWSGNPDDERRRKDVEMYQKYMQRLKHTPALDPQDRLLDIMRTTKSALLSISRRRRKSSLWSPEIVALTANQIAVTEMGRYIEGSKGRPVWKKQKHIDTGMNIILTNWEKQISRLVESQTTLQEVGDEQWLNFSSKGPAYWRSISWQRDDLIVQIICEKRRLSKLVAAQDKTEWYQNVVHRNDRRQRSRLNGTYLRELRSLMGMGHTPFSMDYLIVSDRLLLDQRKIHKVVTQHFEEWFHKKDIHWGFHNKDNDFIKLWQDKTYFLSKHEESNIPQHLLEIVWQAMQHREQETEADAESFELLLNAAPTLDEFREAIRLAPSQSAGGPLDVTYNAMAAWDEHIVEEVYLLLCSLWQDKQVPRFWKWRWLVPIPKVADNVSLDDLRPLMLTDVTRKIWIGIVVNKIQNYWRQHGLLSDAQHGFLEHRSTEGGLVQFRNVLEEARESCTDVYFSSWDIRRAFDRVPKQLLILGWMRLGVPQDLAEYLVSIDIDGLTVVRTPLAQTIWDKKGPSGFADISQLDDKLLESFSTETGTGQGNIDSPLNWTSIMDILLRALEEADRLPFYVRSCSSSGTGLLIVKDLAYADDLISLTSRLDGLQQKADIVCAFCLVFGLEIAVTKLRAYKIHWGGEHTEIIGASMHADNEPLTHYVMIYLHGWKQRKVKVNSFEGTTPVKYLGVLFDLNNQDISSRSLAYTLAHQLIGKLYDKAIDPDLKVEAIMYVVYPKLLYSAQMASWTLKQYHDFDDIFSTYFRKFLGLRKTFPSELLYTSELLCGIGLRRFSNEVHVRKIALLFRGIFSDEHTKQAACNLIHRGLRLQNKKPVFTQYAALDHRFLTSQPLYIRSIVEWLAIAHLQLAKGGQDFKNVSYTTILDYLAEQNIHLTKDQITTLGSYGIIVVGDIISTGVIEDGCSLRKGRTKAVFLATQRAQEMIGRPVRKLFEGSDSFAGVIRYYDHPWFRVDYEDGDSEDLTMEEIWDILTEEVVLTPGLHSPRWLRFQNTHLLFLNELLPPIPPNVSEILLQRDQCYMSTNPYFPMDEGWIWEVLGIQEQQMCIRTWKVRGVHHRARRPRQGDQMVLDSLSLGAATDIWIPTQRVLSGPHLYRVLMGPDVNAKKIYRMVLSIFSQPPLSIDIPKMDVPLLHSLFQEIPFLEGTHCFTDGSLHQDPNPLIEALVPPSLSFPYRQIGSNPCSSGALIIRKLHTEAMEQSELMIKVSGGEDVHCGNSYDIELLLLTLGCVLRWMAAVFSTPPVVLDLFSDCKSAVDKANLIEVGSIRTEEHKEHGFLLRQIYNSRFSPDLKITHVYGHPERRLAKDESWQHLKGEEAGIYLADKVAGNCHSDLLCARPLIETTATEVLLAMRSLEDCVIVRTDGVPILEDPLDLIKQQQFVGYLQRRDNQRAVQRWTNYIQVAARIASPSSNRFTVRSKRTKLVFNWYAREEHLQRSDGVCPLCQPDVLGDTEKHIYLICGNVTIENVRLEALDNLRSLVCNDDQIPPMLLQIRAKLYHIFTTLDDRHLIWKGVVSRTVWEDLVALFPDVTSLPRITSRQIIGDIRKAFSIMGEAVTLMRKQYWEALPKPLMPSYVHGTPTTSQLTWIQDKSQTRLPLLWGTMTKTTQTDWEVNRRLAAIRKHTSVRPQQLPAKRQTSLRTFFPSRRDGYDHGLGSPVLIPSCLVIQQLLAKDG